MSISYNGKVELIFQKKFLITGICMFRIRTQFLSVGLGTGYYLVGWVGHGLQSCGLDSARVTVLWVGSSLGSNRAGL